MSKRVHVVLVAAFQFINDIRKSLIDISNKSRGNIMHRKRPKSGTKEKGEQKRKARPALLPYGCESLLALLGLHWCSTKETAIPGPICRRRSR